MILLARVRVTALVRVFRDTLAGLFAVQCNAGSLGAVRPVHSLSRSGESGIAGRTSKAVCLVLFSLSVAVAQTATPRIVSAANGFLSTLDQKQRASVLFAFDDEKQRARWSNLPTTMVQRAGL